MAFTQGELLEAYLSLQGKRAMLPELPEDHRLTTEEMKALLSSMGQRGVSRPSS